MIKPNGLAVCAEKNMENIRYLLKKSRIKYIVQNMHRKLKSMEKFYQRKEKGIGLENVVFVVKREDVHGLTARTIAGNIICKWLGMERNQYIDHVEEGYCECVMVNKNFEEVGRTLIDLDKKKLVEKYKIYMRTAAKKKYAMISLPGGQKLFLHRFLCGFNDTNYTLDQCVDHINGNSLDNRCANLRICRHKDNMKNIRKENHVCGVSWLRENEKWTARIMSKYRTIYLGNYDSFEEAVYARIKAEKEICDEYGSNASYFYILDLEDPIGEIKKLGFKKPDETERELPLLQKKHERKSKIGEKFLVDLNISK